MLAAAALALLFLVAQLLNRLAVSLYLLVSETRPVAVDVFMGFVKSDAAQLLEQY